MRATPGFCFTSILQSVLFVLFMIFFGIPSVVKYLDKRTMIVFSEEDTNGIEGPAVTFLAAQINGAGNWKSVTEITEKNNSLDMIDHCKKIGLTDLEACISNDTLALSDFLKEATHGYFESKSLLSESLMKSLWTEDISTTSSGRHFTLKLPGKITSNFTDIIRFKFATSPSLIITIWIHDENLFLINANPFRKEFV